MGAYLFFKYSLLRKSILIILLQVSETEYITDTKHSLGIILQGDAEGIGMLIPSHGVRGGDRQVKSLFS